MGDIELSRNVAVGDVSGPYYDESMVCHMLVHPRSVWVGDNPFQGVTFVLMAQIIALVLTTRIIYYLIKPLGQTLVTAQIIAGIIVGPTVIGHSEKYTQVMFPPEGQNMLMTVAHLGFLFHLFIIGVQTDTSILSKCGSTAMFIGIASFIVPYVLGAIALICWNSQLSFYHRTQVSLHFLVALNSMTSFAVITKLLTDLNILNSELGRLATNTCFVNDAISWFLYTFMTAIKAADINGSKWSSLSPVAWTSMFVVVVIYVFRPAIIWLTERSNKRETISETHFIAILMIVLTCGMCTELLGQDPAFGAFLLGICLPDGPPLGVTLTNKLDPLVSNLLVPIIFVIAGWQGDLLAVEGGKTLGIIESIVIVGYIGKFLGTLMTALYCDVPFRDASCLGLAMCCKGLIEVGRYAQFNGRKALDAQAYSLLVLNMLFITGVAGVLIRYLYDPSRRYMSCDRRSILQLSANMQLRILFCIHSEDNVSTMLKLLDASNGTRYSPIILFVVHLMELTGRSSAILAPHHHVNNLKGTATSSVHIANAFRHYEQQHQGRVLTQHFVSVSPYKSMHDDICTLAVDKKTSIIIVPFHKQWTIGGTFGQHDNSIRSVNKNVMNKAPCSVGVLIDKGQLWSNHYGNVSGATSSTLRVGMLFFGSADDWEALAYSRRMAEHPRIHLTVVQFIQENDKENIDMVKKSDSKLLFNFIGSGVGKGKVYYQKEIVKDGIETTSIILSMEDSFDLVLVGKHHDYKSPLISGFNSDWSDCPELGVIADLLVTSDFKFSVLVVIQQPQEFQDNGFISLPHMPSMRFNKKTVDSSAFSTHEEDLSPVSSPTATRLVQSGYSIRNPDHDSETLFHSEIV